jgi:hypothetical protein
LLQPSGCDFHRLLKRGLLIRHGASLPLEPGYGSDALM